jgi:hypothetical protein
MAKGGVKLFVVFRKGALLAPNQPLATTACHDTRSRRPRGGIGPGTLLQMGINLTACSYLVLEPPDWAELYLSLENRVDLSFHPPLRGNPLSDDFTISLILSFAMLHAAGLMSSILARQAPPMQLPPGDPNVGVAQNHATIIAVAVFSIVLGTGSVAARLLSRRASKLAFQADDICIVLALLIANADAAAYIWALRYGFGRHIYTLQPAELIQFFKIVFATFIFYGAAVSFVKFSVLLFYQRIFPQNNFRKWLIVLGVASAVWWILITLVSVFQCSPVQRAWNPTVEGTCLPYLDLFIAIQVANIVLDIAVLCLPISAVMGLQMSKANKITVAGTFGLGGL